MMNLIWMVIFGLIAGGIAKMIMPGKEPGGFLVTAGLGIGGSLLGGFIGNILGFSSADDRSIFGFGLIFSVLGALLILFIWKKYIAPNYFKDQNQ